MALYHEGYQAAVQAVNAMDEQQLLAYLDTLYGRDNLPEEYTLDDLRGEALRQCRQEFTDTTSREHQTVEFFTGLHRLMRREGLLVSDTTEVE